MSVETKARYHLMSLPSSLDNIIANLQSKDSLTYVNVRCCLLKLFSSSNLSSNGKALNTRSHEVHKSNYRKKNIQKPHPTQPGKNEPHKSNLYSYCKKHNHPHEGYAFKLCNRLQTALEDSSSSAPSPASYWDVFPYRPNLTVNKYSDYGIALITSSLPYSIPTIPAGSVFTTTNDQTYEV